MDASLIKTPSLLKKYLADNKIVGVFVRKDTYSDSYKVYEATSLSTGFPTGDYFKTKKAAHIKALEWANKTSLPVLKENPSRIKMKNKVRKKNPANNLDEIAIRELMLYADNEGKLYPQKEAIIKNLIRKINSGKYNPALAPKLWGYWYDNAAKMYAKDMGGSSVEWSRMFPARERKEAARLKASEEFKSIKSGEWSQLEEMLKPKGLRKNPVRPLKIKERGKYRVEYTKTDPSKHPQIRWDRLANFETKRNAVEYAKAISTAYNKMGTKVWIKVSDEFIK